MWNFNMFSLFHLCSYIFDINWIILYVLYILILNSIYFVWTYSPISGTWPLNTCNVKMYNIAYVIVHSGTTQVHPIFWYRDITLSLQIDRCTWCLDACNLQAEGLACPTARLRMLLTWFKGDFLIAFLRKFSLSWILLIKEQ